MITVDMEHVLYTHKNSFSAGHTLYNIKWSAQKNKEIYGLCSSANGHGHNFSLHTTVLCTHEYLCKTYLSHVIDSCIISKVAYCNFNTCELLKGRLPTCENIITSFWEVLISHVDVNKLGGRLHKLALHETKNNFVEYPSFVTFVT